MRLKLFTLLTITVLALGACGLRDSPAVPPAHNTPAPASSD